MSEKFNAIIAAETDGKPVASLREITLEDLVSNQSGLSRDFNGKEWESFFAEKSSPEKERRRMLKYCLKDKPVGQRGKYLSSNLGFVVAAAMIEKQAGQDFESLVRKHLGFNVSLSNDPLNPGFAFKAKSSTKEFVYEVEISEKGELENQVQGELSTVCSNIVGRRPAALLRCKTALALHVTGA